MELLSDDYLNDLKEIKETIRDNQNKAMVIVNSAMIMTYYEIGVIINKRKTWGSKYIQKLSEDLKEYGKGYSYEQLKKMSQIAAEFTLDEIRLQPVTQIAWSTLSTIIVPKSNSHEEMLWYINETYKHGWSRNMVLNQFALKAYERSLIEVDTTTAIKSDDSLNELFKDTYVIDFIDRNKIKTEKDLKDGLIDNIVKFIQELGEDFAFVGKEYKLNIPDDEECFIDILFYHLELHAYIVIEVKNTKFKPDDLGQLLFYVNSIDKLKKRSIDSETIGLLLCLDSNEFKVKTTLEGINKKIGVSKYKFIDEIPEYINKRLKEK